MYEMYPGIHHVEGTRMTVEALGTLTAGAVGHPVPVVP